MICADGCACRAIASTARVMRALAGGLDSRFHGRPPARVLGIRERGLAEQEEIHAEHSAGGMHAHHEVSLSAVHAAATAVSSSSIVSSRRRACSTRDRRERATEADRLRSPDRRPRHPR